MSQIGFICQGLSYSAISPVLQYFYAEARIRPSVVFPMRGGRKIENDMIGAELGRYALNLFRIVSDPTEHAV